MVEPTSAIDTGRISANFSVRFAYSVYFTRRAFATGNPLLAQLLKPSRPNARARVFAAVESAVSAAHPHLSAAIADYCRHYGLDLAGEIFPLPAGEAAKTGGLGIALGLVEAMIKANLDRQSYLLAIGGGSALDAAGLAAALLHRGIRLVRLPTTVLGQNDAGVGVKNGIDYGCQKNAIGTFAPPWAVVDDFTFLDALPERAFSSGFAEAVKVAMIESESFFDRLGEIALPFAKREPAAVEEVIRTTARLHVEHIATAGDPFETGTARPLDFGHWSAHRLEAMSDYCLGHGPAVAIGLMIDSFYAQLQGWISREATVKAREMIQNVKLDLIAAEFTHLLAERESLFQGLDDFRTHLGGELTLTFPCPLGRHREVHEIDFAVMNHAIDLAHAALNLNSTS